MNTFIKIKDKYDQIISQDQDYFDKLLTSQENFESANPKNKYKQQLLNLINTEDPKLPEKYWYFFAKKYQSTLWSSSTTVIPASLFKKSPAMIIYDQLQDNPDTIMIIKSQTGTGKSVMFPQFVYYALHPKMKKGSKIICAQPRRLNAIGLATYVSQLMFSNPGQTVGYDVGGSKNTTEYTSIVYQTIGKLLQDIKGLVLAAETTSDSTEQEKVYQKIRDKYECIILDEVHERSIDQDLLMGFLIRIKPPYRPAIIITSATMKPELYTDYFKACCKTVVYQFGDYPANDQICNIDEKKITCKFLDKDTADYQKEIAVTLKNIFQKQRNSGVLVFLPGGGEIAALKAVLTKSFKQVPIKQLTRDNVVEFQNVINKMPRPKIILATNVAETGITFHNIDSVIDSGWQRVSVYNPETDAQVLLTTSISQDNAIQRRGRIGRTPGQHYTYYAMYTRETWNTMAKDNKLSPPKIYMADLTPYILMLKILFPHKSIYDFQWVSAPPAQSVASAMHKLFHLGAIDLQTNVTAIGHFMNSGALAKVDVPMRRAFYASFQKGVAWEVAVIIAMMQNLNDLISCVTGPNIFANYKSDHITLLHIYRQFLSKSAAGHGREWCQKNCLDYNTIIQIPQQVNELLAIFNTKPKAKAPTTDPDELYLKVLQCLFAGLFIQTGVLPEDTSKYYYTSVGVYAKLDNLRSLVFTNSRLSQAYYPKHIMYSNLAMTTTSAGISQYKLSLVSEFNPNWYGRYAPDYRLMSAVLCQEATH